AVQQLDDRCRSADAREARRTCATAGRRECEPLLDDAVLTRVVREDDAAAARSQESDGVINGSRKNVKFTVDLDTERLEDAFRRVTAAAGRCRHRRGHRVGEL